MIEAPYHQESEEALIGAVLIDPNAYLTIAPFFNYDDFYFLRHSYIWQAMERLHDRKDAIDNITLSKELDDMGFLDDIGGPAFITHLIANTPTSVHAEVYARLVKRMSQRRKLMVAADKVKLLAVDEQLETDEVMSRAYDLIFKTVSDGDTREKTWAEIIYDYSTHMTDTVWPNPDGVRGLATGHRHYDAHTLGLQPSEFLLIAGRPGMGKTVLLLQWALYVAKSGGRVAFWSGEMDAGRMAERATAHISGVSNWKIRRATFDKEEGKRVRDAWGRLYEYGILFWDKVRITPSELRVKALEARALGGIDLLVIDYLNLMDGDGKYSGNSSSYHRVSEISVMLKALGRELGIPILAGVQLNRNLENRQDKRPQLADLRDSGSLEQDADTVIGLYRDDYYNEGSETPGMIEIDLLKYRDGDPLRFYGQFDGATSTIKEAQLREFTTV